MSGGDGDGSGIGKATSIAVSGKMTGELAASHLGYKFLRTPEKLLSLSLRADEAQLSPGEQGFPWSPTIHNPRIIRKHKRRSSPDSVCWHWDLEDDSLGM